MAGEAGTDVRVEVLGAFRVTVGDTVVTAGAWPVRRAAELVQLLALAEHHRLLRDQVIDALWPHLAPSAGAANLRKAAHHARQVLGDPTAVVLRGGQVSLFPGRRVTTDAALFEAAAERALRTGSGQACAEAAATYPGELLPDARYEDWAEEPRRRLRARHLELVRASAAWERVVELDPCDEHAYRELMRQALAAGNRHAALRWYGRMRTALERELALRPGAESEALYEECVTGLLPADRAVVGRGVEIAWLDATLRAAARGERSVLALRGPGGIGKSALCRTLVTTASGQGWTVVAVRATPDSGPYAPLVQVAEDLLGRDRTLADRLPGRARSVLAELTGLAAPATPLDAPVTRHQVIGAVRRVLLAASAGPGVLLVVDDAHHADDDAAEALMHLAGVAGQQRLLVALAYRSSLAGAVLARGVARLDRAGMAAVLDVGPLEPDEAAALVRAASPGSVPDREVTRIVDLAGGSPFFVLELVRSRSAGRPATAGEAVSARLLDLDEGSRSMVQRLAVAGDEFDPPAVLAVTGMAERDAFALLDAAIAAEVLVVSGAGYRFRHELIRQALVEQVPPHRRVAVHRDAARRLATAGGTPDTVARHWLSGGRPEEAVPWLLAAARRAVSLGAFGDALGHLDVLLEHAPGHAEALCLRAESLEATGDERAPAAYAAAARVAGEREWHDIRAKQALASVRAGDPAGAVVALEGVEATTLEGRIAQALALCGAAAMGFADPAVGEAEAVRTRKLAVESGDPAAVVIASWAEAAAAHARGDLPSSLRTALRESYALPELAITVFDGHLCVAERLLYGYRPYDEVLAFADQLEAEADRLGAARGKAFATTFRGEAELLIGRLDDAQVDLSRGIELHRGIGAAGGEALSLQRLAEVWLYRGEPDKAHKLLDEALAVARDSNLGFHLFDRIYGSMITAAPDAGSALAALEEAEEAVHGSMETCPGCRIALAVPAAIAAARAGDLDRAAVYESAAEKLTSILMRLPGWYAAVDEVRAFRAHASGRRADATRHLSAAVAGFRGAGQVLDADRCAKVLADWA